MVGSEGRNRERNEVDPENIRNYESLQWSSKLVGRDYSGILWPLEALPFSSFTIQSLAAQLLNVMVSTLSSPEKMWNGQENVMAISQADGIPGIDGQSINVLFYHDNGL